MPTSTPSTPASPKRPATRGKKKPATAANPTPTAARKTRARAARPGTPAAIGGKARRDDKRRSLVLPLPPTPGEVVATVREELGRLSRRWKALLPRLESAGAKGRKSGTATSR